MCVYICDKTFTAIKKSRSTDSKDFFLKTLASYVAVAKTMIRIAIYGLSYLQLLLFL